MVDTNTVIRVLHVDDEPGYAEMVATFLEREDDRITVQTAENPTKGQQLLETSDFDCVVSDYDMPERDGIEFLETVRRQYPDLPFVLYTGKGSEEVASEAIPAGVSDYLQKENTTDHYSLLANRIINLVAQYRAEVQVEYFSRLREEDKEFRNRLLEIVSDQERPSDDKIERMLALGCERFDVENGHLVMIDQDRGRHNVVSVVGSDVVEEGVSDLSETYCRKTIESEEMLEIHNAVEQGWDADPAYEEFGLGSYLGGKLMVGDTVVGTLCFADENPREPFTHYERLFFEMLLRWFGQMVERRRLGEANTIFENTQDGLFVVDVNDDTFTIRRVNPAYTELTGRGSDDVVDYSLREILDVEDWTAIEARFRECIEAREPIEYDERVSFGDEKGWWHVKLAPVIEDGEVIQLVGALRDVTDRRQRERALQRVRRRLEAILENTTTPMFMKDDTGAYVLVNQEYRDLFGLDDTGIIGRTDHEIHPTATAAEVTANDAAVLERGEPIEAEERIQVDGEERIFLTSKVPIYDTGDRSDPDDPVAVFGVATDITDRTAYQQKLQEEQQFVQSIFDALPDALYAFDTDGNLVRWNERLTTVTGYTDEELDGMAVSELVPADETEKILAEYHSILEERTTVTVESAFETKHGERIPYEFTAGPLEDPDGTLRGVTGIGRDLRGRLEREQDLKQKNALLSTLFDTLPQGIIAENESRELLAVNQQAFDLFDLQESPTEVIGADCERMAESISEMFVDSDQFIDRINDLVSERKPVDKEELPLTDGRTLERTHRPIELPDGNGHLWVYRDITERKNREERLRETASRLEALFDDSPDMVDVLDSEGRLVEVNSRFSEELEYDEDDVLGRPIWEIDQLVDADDVRALLSDFETDERRKFEGRYERADGSSFPVEVHLLKLDIDGEDRFLAISRDITERKERERERTKTIEFLQHLYDVATTAELDVDEKITRLLHLGPETLGLPYGHLTRIRTDEGSHEEGVQRVIEASGDHDLLQPGGTCPLSESYCRKTVQMDGLMQVHDTIAAGWDDDPAYERFGLGCYIGTKITVGDELYGTVFFAAKEPREEPFSEAEQTFVRLMSQLVSYELERERAMSELAEQNQRLEEFTSIVSHDLRNPLNVAQGRLELAREESDSDHLDGVERAHTRMNALIDDLLTFAREGETATEIASVDLAALADNCWQNVETKDATLVTAIDRTIRADESRLRQLFENLIRNSVEHGGTDVTVTVGELEDGFYIADDGSGIPEDQRETVFETGYTTSSGGTGFGLSIVEQAVDAHDWNIRITEGPEGGARFEITGVTETIPPEEATSRRESLE